MMLLPAPVGSRTTASFPRRALNTASPWNSRKYRFRKSLTEQPRERAFRVLVGLFGGRPSFLLGRRCLRERHRQVRRSNHEVRLLFVPDGRKRTGPPFQRYRQPVNSAGLLVLALGFVRFGPVSVGPPPDRRFRLPRCAPCRFPASSSCRRGRLGSRAGSGSPGRGGAHARRALDVDVPRVSPGQPAELDGPGHGVLDLGRVGTGQH